MHNFLARAIVSDGDPHSHLADTAYSAAHPAEGQAIVLQCDRVCPRQRPVRHICIEVCVSVCLTS